MEKIKRESRKDFWARVEQEGRRAEVEALQAELLVSGESKRSVQAALVQRFQALDGTKSTFRFTPDSWSHGRMYWKKPPPDNQEQFDRNVQWVHDHPGQEPPTNGAKLLLKLSQDRPSAFVSIYLDRLPHIVERQQKERKAQSQKIVARRNARRRRVEAQKRAISLEAARQREETARQAKAEEEAHRQVEAEKFEQERFEHQQEQSLKPDGNGQEQNVAVLAKVDDWEEL